MAEQFDSIFKKVLLEQIQNIDDSKLYKTTPES
jgi:hypothetical protein